MFLTKQTNRIMELVEKISKEKQISKHIIIDALKEGYEKIFEKLLPTANINVFFNSNINNFEIFRIYTITKKITNKDLEITISKAKKKKFKINKEKAIEIVDTSKFSRRIINQFGQIIKQIIREAEKNSIYEEFKFYLHKIYRGKVNIIEPSYILIQVKRTYAFLPKKNCIFSDNFKINDYIDFYVEDVLKKTKKPAQIIASRTHPEFLKLLFKQEIPEVFQKIILIKDVARYPGIRSKVSVYTNDKNIDPVGSCIGNNGYRIKKISEQLNFENIDVVKYSEDLSTYIQNIFLPAKISFIQIDKIKNKITIYLPKDQMSLAIGKNGSIIKLCSMILKNYQLDLVDDSTVDLKQLEAKLAQDEAIVSKEKKAKSTTSKKEVKKNLQTVDKKQILDLEKKRMKDDTKAILAKIEHQKIQKIKKKLTQKKKETTKIKKTTTLKPTTLKAVKTKTSIPKTTKTKIKKPIIKTVKTKKKTTLATNLKTKDKKILVDINKKTKNKPLDQSLKPKVLKPKPPTKKIKKKIKVKKIIKPVINVDKNLKISTKDKDLFKKYKHEFNLLSAKIELLNDSKYKNNHRAQEIKLTYINLYQYFNDQNQNIDNIKLWEFLKLQQEITLVNLKKCHQFITKFEKEFKREQLNTKFKH